MARVGSESKQTIMGSTDGLGIVSIQDQFVSVSQVVDENRYRNRHLLAFFVSQSIGDKYACVA